MPEQNFEDEREVLKSLVKWIDNFMHYIFARSQENLIKNKSVDTGFLLKSGRPPTWKDGECIIRYTAPYALFVEYGTGPHPINPKKLVGWVRRKLGIRDPKALSVAYAVARKISREGTEPKPFLRPAVNEALEKFNIKAKPLEVE